MPDDGKNPLVVSWEGVIKPCVPLKILDLFTAITPVRQSKRSQGYDKWAMRPHMAVLLPTQSERHPEVLKCIPMRKPSTPQCAGHTALSYFPESAWITCLTHVAAAQSWQAFSGQDTPATDLLKSKSPKYPWLTNHPSLPARVAIQTAYWVLWPAQRLLMISGLWCIICDLIGGVVHFYFGYSIWKPVLSCQQFMSCSC